VVNKIERELADKSLIFVSRKPLKSNVKFSILDIIHRCYRDGHLFSSLLTIPNQYDNNFFKTQLQGLINRNIVVIVRVANEKHTRFKEYKAIDMTVKSLAVWHSYLGVVHARRVLGVRHEERGARKRKKHSAATRAKICEARTGKRHSYLGVHARRVLGVRHEERSARKRKKHSAATRAKICEARTGKKHSAATLSKISEAKMGKKHSAEHSAKISEANLGKKRPRLA
jgi:hypothetical protein